MQKWTFMDVKLYDNATTCKEGTFLDLMCVCRTTGHRWQWQQWWETIHDCIGSLAFCQWTKKLKNISKCIPIDTNQHNPTKIIDGCQELKEILADINSCDQNCSYAKWLNWERGKWNPWCHLVAGEFSIRWQHLISYSFTIMYVVQLYKEDLAYVGLSGRNSPQYRANSKLIIPKFFHYLSRSIVKILMN